MPKLIKDGSIVKDNWRLDSPLEESVDQFSPEESVMVSVESWLAHRELLIARPGQTGIWLEGSQALNPLAADLHHFQLIAVHFPAFSDGRGFSLGMLLRERYGYCGELRAVGNILIGQLFYLKRCGFNAFAPTDNVNLTEACQALSDFSESYQEAWDQPVPLFRRR